VDTSIKNDVDNEISDSEVNDSLRNHHSSSILSSQIIENQVRPSDEKTNKITSQSNPIDSEKESQSKLISKSYTTVLKCK